MAFNYAKFQQSNGMGLGLNRIWTYTDTTQTMAAIIAGSFFNPVNELNPQDVIVVGDLIWIQASDANQFVEVDAVSPNITVAAFNAVLGAGSVGTANLAANAVETAKIADANVTSAKLEDGLVHYERVSVNLASFIGSNTAPVEILAAPGAGLKYVIHRASLGIDYGGVVLANGGTVQLTYGAAAGDAASIATGNVAAATLIAATADTMFGFSPVDTTLTDAKTVNKAVSLSTETADFTGGTGSTYEVDIWYSIVAQV